MITGDLDRALATAIGSAGTWRPAPPGTACEVRTYVTTIAFWLARGHAGGPGTDGPAAVAAGLATRLSGLDWVEAAAVTGGGYLAATVTTGRAGPPRRPHHRGRAGLRPRQLPWPAPAWPRPRQRTWPPPRPGRKRADVSTRR